MTIPTGKKERVWHDPPMPGEIPSILGGQKPTGVPPQGVNILVRSPEEAEHVLSFFKALSRRQAYFLLGFNSITTAIIIMIAQYLEIPTGELIKFFLVAGVVGMLIGLFFVRIPKMG